MSLKKSHKKKTIILVVLQKNAHTRINTVLGTLYKVLQASALWNVDDFAASVFQAVMGEAEPAAFR